MRLNEMMTAWATLTIAAGTLVSVWVSYRAFRNQVKSFAMSVSADLALKLARDFDSQESIERRGRIAHAFLNRHKIAETDDLFDFFEKIGFLFGNVLSNPT